MHILRNKPIINLGVFVILSILLLSSFCYVSELLTPYWVKDSLKVFNENDFDIWFVGTSHMKCAANPWVIWSNNQLTSYDLVIPGNGFDRELALLKILLEKKKPKLVVLDLDEWWQAESDEYMEQFHSVMDDISFKDKIIPVLQMNQSKQRKEEILFPFVKYHSRWKELEDKDFNYERDDLYIGYTYIEGYEGTDLTTTSGDSLGIETNLLELRRQRIIDILELLKNHNIPVIITAIPHPVNRADVNAYESFSYIADMYGFKFLNFTDNNASMIDSRIGFGDTSHLNPIGSYDFSCWMGNYIENNFPDIKDDNNQCSNLWHDGYRQHHEDICMDIKQANDEWDKLVLAATNIDDFEIVPSSPRDNILTIDGDSKEMYILEWLVRKNKISSVDDAIRNEISLISNITGEEIKLNEE